MKRAIHGIILLATLLFGARQGRGQGAPAAPSTLPRDLLSGAALGAAGRAADPRVSTITKGRSGAAKALAASYPEAQRAAVETLFEQLLQAYPQVERSVGVPAGDAAGALAIFVIAAFEAHRGVEVDPAHYGAVVDQLRRVLQADPGFARASARQKRELYEQTAIVGMFVAARRGEARKSGDPAAIRAVHDAGGDYLSRWGRVDPDLLQIGRRGLSVDPGDPPTTGPAERPAKRGESAPPGTRGRFPVDRLAVVLFSWEQVYEFTGLQLHQTPYLLFKDGTCTTALPTALEDLDPAASKAAHPDQWGRWRRRGKEYEVALGRKRFEAPPHQVIREPARRGERLSGRWSISSSGSVAGATSYWSTDSVELGADGRFVASSTGGMGGTIEGGAPGESTTTTTVRDDEGSSTSISGPNLGGGRTRRTGKSKADRSGTYRLDGYGLELRYDSGRVERHLFFASPDRSNVFFRGSNMWRPRK